MRILIVAGCYAPSAVVGAKRPTGVAIELLKQGHSPFVLTTKQECYVKIDSSRDLAELLQIPTIRTRCYSIWNHSRKWRTAKNPIDRTTLLFGNVVARITRKFCGADVLEPWARRAAIQGEQIVKHENIDLIWATVPHMSSALLAKKIHDRTGVPFVVDYRDLLAYDEDSPVARKRLTMEQVILKSCAGITCVAPRQIETLHQQLEFTRKIPASLVYNFFDEENRQDLSSPGEAGIQPYMIYGGALYGGQRRIDGVISALACLNDPSGVDLRLEFFGDVADQKYVANLGRANNIPDSIVTSNNITQTEFNRRCQNSAIQLLIVGHGPTHEDTIPGKLFDYLRAMRPILVVGPRNSSAAQMTEELNHGIATADDDVDEILSAIGRLINQQNRAGQALDLSPGSVMQYSRPQVVGGLIRFFESLI